MSCDIAEILFKAGTDLDAVDEKGQTAMMIAILQVILKAETDVYNTRKEDVMDLMWVELFVDGFTRVVTLF